MGWIGSRLLPWMTLALCAALLVACGGGGGSGGVDSSAPSPGTGRVAILLTDAPTEAFDAINVTIAQVYLLAGEKKVLVLDNGSDGITRNLLDLRDSAELLLVPAAVEAGCYDKIRLVVSRVELRRGEESFDAKLPANGKIDLNPRGTFCVVPGETLVLQLDLDAENSIHVVENKHGTEYNFRPVVFVTVVDGKDDVLGKLVRLSGRVDAVGTDRFTLCDTESEPVARPTGENHGCTEVVLGEETSLFDLDGTPFVRTEDEPLESAVFEDDFVRVVGRYTVMVESNRDSGDVWDEMDQMLRRFHAEVVETGVSPQTWARYDGEILPGGFLNGECEGIFEFRLDEGQGITRDLDISVHLYLGSRVFGRDGEALDCTDLQVGTRAVVDAVVSRSDESDDVLNAAVVITRIEPQTRIEGTLQSVESGGRILGVLPDGAAEGEIVCVRLAPELIPLLYTPAVGDAGETFEEVALNQEHVGLAILVVGSWAEGEECFSAGNALVTAPVPEPEAQPTGKSGT